MRNKSKVSLKNKLNTSMKDMADDSNALVDTNLKPDKNAVDLSGKANGINEESEKNRRDLILTHKEAKAGSPNDTAACGEEDTAVPDLSF